ncbi:DUF4349 domain-containing protein [Nocardia sp. NBC_01377]|uniref:DUF4349 domain-containing protein n=1 Tax=Nocardia sp. NBC_01377 TaxID=2903595 RepID=UPI003252F8AE
MRKLAVLCIGLLGSVLLVACGSDDMSSSSPSPTVGKSMPAPAISPPGLREQAGESADSRGQAADTVARKEVVTGRVDLTADDPIAAAATVADQVRAAGGRIDNRTEAPGTEDGDPSASLTVRVPADKTDAFIDGLGGLGKVTRVSTNREDVTMQWEDLDAKIKALQSSVDRLRVLMAGATNTADLLAAESALSSRQGELDSLTAQKKLLDDQVSLSSLTIAITATEKKSETDDGPGNFSDGIVSGWNSLVDWLQDAVVFVGKAIPWAGFLLVVGAVVWGIARVVRRRPVSSGAGVERGRAAGSADPVSDSSDAKAGVTKDSRVEAASGDADVKTGTAKESSAETVSGATTTGTAKADAVKGGSAEAASGEDASSTKDAKGDTEGPASRK